MPNSERYKAQMMSRKNRRNRRIKDGLVLCENDDTPASTASFAVGWFGCGACIFGSSSEIDPSEFITEPAAIQSLKESQDGGVK